MRTSVMNLDWSSSISSSNPPSEFRCPSNLEVERAWGSREFALCIPQQPEKDVGRIIEIFMGKHPVGDCYHFRALFHFSTTTTGCGSIRYSGRGSVTFARLIPAINRALGRTTKAPGTRFGVIWLVGQTATPFLHFGTEHLITPFGPNQLDRQPRPKNPVLTEVHPDIGMGRIRNEYNLARLWQS